MTDRPDHDRQRDDRGAEQDRETPRRPPDARRRALVEPGEHLVVVVAHPDDETFGCGSLIAQAAGAGARVTVVCATRGEAGERVDESPSRSRPLAEVREEELRAAGAVLGVSAFELLGLVDSGFDGPLPGDALCALAVGDLAGELCARFARLAPDVVLVLDGGDGHRDHRHLRDASELAVRGSPRPIRFVESCLANSLMRRWVEEMRQAHPATAYLDLDPAGLGRPDGELTAIDVEGQRAVREAAIRCHRSQRSPYEDLSSELRDAFLSIDYVVERALP